MLKQLVITVLIVNLTGCAQMLAAASGSQPVGATEGQRTLSQRIEDISIEKTAAINLYKADPQFKNAHVVFMSFHSNVLIAGQVLNAKQKQVAEDTVRAIGEVKQIHNELSISPQINPYLGRAKDSIISAQISTSLTFAKDFPSSQCKVLVEEGTVYLMGKLTRAQAEQAIGLIKNVQDIKKIIKMVDYLD
ncbi:BON domain-containing protein [Agitococcus lubricus]|uniref:Osmotically-inducible protein OsmY n=1 Tax=Agitococcus lubricus TaxID=1077255 RepID=A0A2T5J0L2_9GAMM|nr:BON domain-containing protein [Agitococcus lubricus]PTQ89884.1 osmotically-inducible protein OsmY [Agitococcus lubricus]